MNDRYFLYQLALERCQQALAQLCAIHHVRRSEDVAAETLSILIRNLDQDIEFLKEFPVDMGKPEDFLHAEDGQND